MHAISTSAMVVVVVLVLVAVLIAVVVSRRKILTPTVGAYFKATGSSVGSIYGQCLEVDLIEPDLTRVIYARCYSKMCPGGESGNSLKAHIVALLSEEEFRKAQADGWP